jgi:hypothetical protein
MGPLLLLDNYKVSRLGASYSQGLFQRFGDDGALLGLAIGISCDESTSQ